MLSVTANAAFADNYILAITRDHSNDHILVDPGQIEPVLAFIEARQLTLKHILITHWHGDHTGAGKELQKRYPACIVFGPEHSAIPANIRVHDGDELIVSGQRFHVYHTPGHTLEHVVYHCPDWNTLFSGDTLFAAGCGRLFEGDATMMLASLQRLAALNPSTQIYCAHEYTLNNLRFALAVEPDNVVIQQRLAHCQQLRQQGQASVPSFLHDELQSNPFLRSHLPALKQTLRQRAGHSLSDIEAFAVLRQWKDIF